MVAIIAGIIQIILLVFKTKMESDDAERKKKDENLKGWDEAIKSRDLSRINAVISRMSK